MAKIKIWPHHELCPDGAEIVTVPGETICEAALREGIKIEHACGGGRQSRQFSGRGGGGGGRGPGRGPSSNQQPTSWRRVPPADGASETIKKQGVPYYWCAKCRHWNKTHVTL